ncbi:MAG TPA: CHAD domain-containing protein [Bacteroidota bacterium]|nr:CHAD domain-containing protein [Bacteroidota bacterium]
MAKRSVLKPNKSFRENARLLLPVLLDDFLSRKDRIVGHPRLKNDFHKMRLAGKTLRYAMEVFQAAFGDEFSGCLDDVKQLLDVMGQVTDCDVNVPVLRLHLREMRSFNRVTASQHDAIRTKALTDLIHIQQTRRTELFNEACASIERLGAEDFRQRLIRSMSAVSATKE